MTERKVDAIIVRNVITCFARNRSVARSQSSELDAWQIRADGSNSRPAWQFAERTFDTWLRGQKPAFCVVRMS